MLIVESLCYFLALMPLLADRLIADYASSSAARLAMDLAQGLVILALVLTARRTRRLAERIDSLRKTMNEAIIHDLKNPMTSIMGCLSCVRDDEMAVDQRRKFLDLALHGCKEQMTLLDTLVDTNRIERGELSIQKQAIDTGGLMGECLNGVRGTAAQLGVKLEVDLPRAFPATISADPELLTRVILNLLHNALKYTRAGGTVGLHARIERESLRFEIRDTGIGIAPEHIDRLFGKYYRVEGGDQTGRRGTGLGLYFCRMVIEAHGGTIRVTSDMGKGTSIWFDLPVPAGG